jgi:hypothetical protein
MAREKRWTPTAIALLGTMPDTHIAKRLGCSQSTVRAKRIRLGILSPGRTKWAWKWGPWELGMIGKKSDKQVAKITGRSLSEVIAKREELEL